jgi:hypothetical protein
MRSAIAMSFIQTELDHAAFTKPAAWPDAVIWLPQQPNDASPWPSQPATRAPATIIIDATAASGLPGLAIPLLSLLTLASPPAWLLASLSLPLLVGIARAAAPRSRSLTWLSIGGYAGLAVGLNAIAADHIVAAVATAGTLPITHLALPLMAGLLASSWFLARRKVTLASRDLLVIQGLTLALTLIVLANRATLGGGAAAYQGTTPISSIAAEVGLTTLSPILSAGIAFSFFIAGLRSFKALISAHSAVSVLRSPLPR